MDSNMHAKSLYFLNQYNEDVNQYFAGISASLCISRPIFQQDRGAVPANIQYISANSLNHESVSHQMQTAYTLNFILYICCYVIHNYNKAKYILMDTWCNPTLKYEPKHCRT